MPHLPSPPIFGLYQVARADRVDDREEADHGGDEDAGNDEVEDVVERPPPQPDGDGDVEVRLDRRQWAVDSR